MTAATLIAEWQRARINENYLESRRRARMRPLYVIALVAVTLVVFGAFLVDYMIVSEFWTRTLVNEFLELPEGLGASVAFKSLQVLFATVAAHILYEHMGPWGRAAFVRIVFVLSLVMLAGIGLLLALMSLPNAVQNITATGTASLSAALADLGLGTAAPAAGAAGAAAAGTEIAGLQSAQPIFWMASLGVVFLVVTGVGALCLHFATDNLKKLFASFEYNDRRQEMARLAALETEYEETRNLLAELDGHENRRQMLWSGLMREAEAYARGLEKARRRFPSGGRSFAPGSMRRLLGSRSSPSANLPVASSNDDPASQLEQLRSQHQVGWYESLFDEWWARRSRTAMGAGPDMGTTDRPVDVEILDPIVPGSTESRERPGSSTTVRPVGTHRSVVRRITIRRRD